MLKIHLKTVHDVSNIVKIYFFSVKSLMGKPLDWKSWTRLKKNQFHFRAFRGILVLGQTRAQRQGILLLCQTRAQRHHFFWPPFFFLSIFLRIFFLPPLIFFQHFLCFLYPSFVFFSQSYFWLTVTVTVTVTGN